MARARWVHSVPAWTLGPRAANPKFGGNIVLDGIPEVRDRLLAIPPFSKKLNMVGDDAILTSGHTLLEFKTGIRKYQRYNAPGSISVKDLKAGIKAGEFPRILAITAPQFGFTGAERGGMISPLIADRLMAYDLHRESIELAADLKSRGLGEGVCIWWPAFTSRKFSPTGQATRPFDEARKMMVEFWVTILTAKPYGEMHLEWKPGDPGIDYLCTIKLAIEFCNDVNRALGRKAMYINNEFAHILLQGITVYRGVEQTIAAGLFTGFVHANSNLMYPIDIQTLIDRGVPVESILGGLDLDLAVGVGDKDIWCDQQNAIGLMDGSGVPTAFCEHDLNPSGEDPFKVHELSIANVEKMLTAPGSRNPISKPIPALLKAGFFLQKV